MSDARVADRELLALASLLETEIGSSLTLMIEQIRGFSNAKLDRLTSMSAQGSSAQSILDLVLAEREAPRLQAAFLQWASEGADLEQGVLLVARSGYPRLDAQSVQATLDRLADEVRGDLPHHDEAGMLQRLIYFVETEKGFHGNEQEYYDPENSYLNRVLERRSGLPITLSVLYILLGRRLGMPISGIALPNHFVATMTVPGDTILFDPFHGGKLLSEEDVATIAASAGQVLQPGHLSPATSSQIVQRMLGNLVHAYDLHEELERTELVKQYLSVLA